MHLVSSVAGLHLHHGVTMAVRLSANIGFRVPTRTLRPGWAHLLHVDRDVERLQDVPHDARREDDALPRDTLRV